MTSSIDPSEWDEPIYEPPPTEDDMNRMYLASQRLAAVRARREYIESFPPDEREAVTRLIDSEGP